MDVRSILKFLTVIGLSITLVSCANDQEAAAQSARAAQSAMESGDLEGARKLALEAVRKRDSEVTYWQLLAAIELQRNSLPEAYNAFIRVIELDAGNVPALQLVAEIAFQINDYKKSSDMAERALVLDPTSTRALLVTGLLALERRKPGEATAIAEKILTINPKDEFGAILLARAQASTGKFASAAALIHQRIPAPEQTEASLVTLVELYRRLGDQKGITAALDALIAKRPKDVQTQIDYAEILYRSGQMAAARKRLMQVLDSETVNHETRSAVTNLWRRYDTAAVSNEDSARFAKSNDPLLKIEVARYLLDQRQVPLAQALMRPLASDPNEQFSREAMALSARGHFIAGQTAQAAVLAEDVLKEDPRNGEALMVRAQIRQSKNNLTGALEDAQLAVSDMPENADARILLAGIAAKRDGVSFARRVFEEGLITMPQSEPLTKAYAAFLTQNGEKEAAKDRARRFTQGNPSSVQGWLLYNELCKQSPDAQCGPRAAEGLSQARALFTIDERPGTPTRRGLFGNMQVNCGADGTVCQ